jgi:hypothetical protein
MSLSWQDGPLMLATARDGTAPLLGRGHEQELLASLLEEVAGSSGQISRQSSVVQESPR